MRPILFLDIDGVLNGSEMFNPTSHVKIRRDCASRLSWVLLNTNALVVISSSWRYIVLQGDMTLAGFDYMLRSHGIASGGRLIGPVTPSDEDIDGRGRQIRAWMNEHGDCRRYCVLDDDDDGIRDEGHPFVQTNGSLGLTEEDADLVIAVLNGEKDSY